MEDLKNRINKMLEGEKKRREIAIRWLQEVEDIVLPLAIDMWGEDDDENSASDCPNSVWLRNKEKKQINLYFRYKIHHGTNQKEETGFYQTDGGNYMACWGTLINELRGNYFWWAIRSIMEWVELLVETITVKEEAREKLIKKIIIECTEYRKKDSICLRTGLEVKTCNGCQERTI